MSSKETPNKGKEDKATSDDKTSASTDPNAMVTGSFGPPITEENMNSMIVNTIKQMNEIYEMTKNQKDNPTQPPEINTSSNVSGDVTSVEKDAAEWGDILNKSGAITVMTLLIPMVQILIIKNQLIVNDQLKQFDDDTGIASTPQSNSDADAKGTEDKPDAKGAEDKSDVKVDDAKGDSISSASDSLDSVGDSAGNLYAEKQLEVRSKLITLISQFNCKVCILIINCLQIIGSAAYGIADKTFPVDVIIHLTEMISNIVVTGDKFNNQIDEEMKNVEDLKDLKPQDPIKNAKDKAHAKIEQSQKYAEKTAQHQADLASQTATQTVAKGGTNKKKNIHSLKKKHLFNQKTLKIRNRLHKLLLR